MSDFKFACPLCDQHIKCDERLGGQQIKCPSCGGDILIPLPQSPAAAPPPPPPSPPQPAVRVSAAPRPVTPAAAPTGAARFQAALDAEAGGERGGKTKRVLALAATVVVLGVVAFVGFKLATSAQQKFNEARQRDSENNEGGGQVSHIAELYQVLDATDPDKRRGLPASTPASKTSGKYRALAKDAAQATPGAQELPVVKPTWTLELADVKLQPSKANGVLSGAEFTPDAARLDAFTASSYALTLRQGEGFIPDREATVYLRLKPGEKIEGHTWTVTKDKTTDVPQVIKRWKPASASALQQKTYKNGHVMKLEFEKASEGILPGRIYLALPDDEKSVVAGSFIASIRVVTPTGQNRPKPAGQRDYDGGE
jgi:hypothetical protein